MSIAARLIALRKEKGRTQQETADKIGLHVNQVRRYESGSALPSLEALKKIAVTLSVSIDSLVFDPGERGPQEEGLKLRFEAVSQLDPQEKTVILELIDGMLLKHDAKRWTASRASGQEEKHIF
jgi:transcriptional regulator with XRE-family HTH domain